jgi:hypothetical protein
MSEVVIFNPNDEQAVPITWDGLGALTISSVTFDALVDATVTAVGISGNVTTFKLTGADHGRTYQVRATATLSNGNKVARTIAVRCFNG